jgi:hypothetical protein
MEKRFLMPLLVMKTVFAKQMMMQANGSYAIWTRVSCHYFGSAGKKF